MNSRNPIGAGTMEAFKAQVESAIERFQDAALVRRVALGKADMSHYHAILLTLFPQSYSGPYNIALAAVRCDWKHGTAKEYLLRHAAEEATHWRWILNDLRDTGYAGVDPRATFPTLACQSYNSFVEYISQAAPYTRLATASVLEGIAARFGARYGTQLIQQLGLRPEQATFFFRHAETDVEHSKEIEDAIAGTALDSSEWAWMAYVAETAGNLYCAMYDQPAFH